MVQAGPPRAAASKAMCAWLGATGMGAAVASCGARSGVRRRLSRTRRRDGAHGPAHRAAGPAPLRRAKTCDTWELSTLICYAPGNRSDPKTAMQDLQAE